MPKAFSFLEDLQQHIQQRNKGKSLLEFPNSYVIIDLETTGLDPRYNEIIEVGALKIVNNEIVDSYNEFVKPRAEVDDFITLLTGITNDMLVNALPIEDVLPGFLNFIGIDSILMGHNVHFDVNLLYDNFYNLLNHELNNNLVDTLRLSRRFLPDLENHKLITLSDFFKCSPSGPHRALTDCKTIFNCYENIRQLVLEEFSTYEDAINSLKRKRVKSVLADVDTSKISSELEFLVSNRGFTFTGVLDSMQRKDAMQAVIDLGGFICDKVTGKTNFLVLGNTAYCSNVKDGKTNKFKRAEVLKSQHQDIEIISESVFLDMLQSE